MIDNKTYPTQQIFKYHYCSVKKRIKIRYGIAYSNEIPAKGIFLLLHGRAEFSEKYESIAKKLQAQGFMVISPDWRGQGLSFRELENRHKGYIRHFDDYIDDLDAFYLRVVQPFKLPVYILAHSMGGHIALHYMSRHPLKITKAVLVSPMIDIELPVLIKPAIKFLSKKFSRTSLANEYTFGSNDYSSQKVKFKGNNLCHDPEQFQILHDEIKKNPDLALGGVTWSWLNAAFESIGILKQDDIIKKIITPILMVSAQKDSIVSPKAQKRLHTKLSNSRFISIDGAFHELLFEVSELKSQFWHAFNKFIL
jgi:lysophospholipase